MKSAPNSIKAVDRSSIHRITSGQVVIDLQTAVKELVENSLDAGATSIEVRFKQYGINSVEVIDNGSGIAEEDYDSICLKHHTSKLSSFADLTTVQTFGFRGEALSSLCALCESVVVTTAAAPPMGVVLEMLPSGKVGKRSKVARQRGTTIVLTNPFLPLPVRRKEFQRNAKREFGKAMTLLNAYALVPCSSGTGVRLTVSNQLDKSGKTVQLRTQGVTSLHASVTSLWGPKALENVLDLDLAFNVERPKSTTVHIQARGLISKFSVGCGRTGTDRQFFYVNGRPCNLTKVQKAFNEVYHTFNATQAPFIVVDFIIPTDCCDVNVSPDKRTIFVQGETELVAELKVALETTFAPARSTFDLTQTQLQTVTISSKRCQPSEIEEGRDNETEQADVTQTSIVSENTVSKSEQARQLFAPGSDDSDEENSPPPQSSSVLSTTAKSASSDITRVEDELDITMDTVQASWSQTPEVKKDGRKRSSSQKGEGERPAKKQKPATSGVETTSGNNRLLSPTAGGDEEFEETVHQVIPVPKLRRKTKPPSAREDIRQHLAGFARAGSQIAHVPSSDGPGEEDGEEEGALDGIMDVDPQEEEIVDLTDASSVFELDPSICTPSSSQPVDRPEVIRTAFDSGQVDLRVSLELITARWKARLSAPAISSTSTSNPPPSTAAAAFDPEAEAQAEETLSRVIGKEDFGSMDILGQFNLGFIVVRRRKGDDKMDDLFIVDQHAADEKYNFETLQQTTCMRSQKLFRPEILELTASDEMVALENIEVLRKNGFEIDTPGVAEEGQGRLKLVARPVSKDTVFDLKDLEELIHLMQDHPNGQMVRCSKARAMFAMRACRKSVMIGMPLTKAQMTTVVQHMGTMDLPWNCPHGRPTMRHLYDIRAWRGFVGEKRRIDWSAF